MDVQDGFIVGIYNYCDRWCERCAFTSDCRLFADRVEHEAAKDPALKAVVEAPPLPWEVAPPPPPWLQELIDEVNDAAMNPPTPEEWERIRPRVPPEHVPVDTRAHDYAIRTHRWLAATRNLSRRGGDGAREVIGWYHMLIATKINRALTVWPDGDPEDAESDSNGSAKVALIGIGRSHAAWLELVERGEAAAADAALFVEDLLWLQASLERIRPRARAFIRPGLDEPEAVARFRAQEG